MNDAIIKVTRVGERLWRGVSFDGTGIGGVEDRIPPDALRLGD